MFASTFEYVVGTGGPFLLTVTYAPRVALTPSATTYTGSLTAGVSQMFSYLPSTANVFPASFYASVATASGAAGQVALFTGAPAGTGKTGVAPFSLEVTSYVDSVLSTQPTLYNGFSCLAADPTQCVWYMQVLALTNVSSYTLTITDPPPVTTIVPGVPSTVTLPSTGSCAEVVFQIPPHRARPACRSWRPPRQL